MHNAWTKEAPEHLLESTCCSTSSFTATKSGIVLLFLQYASWIELLLGGGPFIRQSVVEITTTVTNRHDELDEVVCDLLSSSLTV